MDNQNLKRKIKEFIEQEGKSCSMDISGITPEYIYRMWGGKVSLENIKLAMEGIDMRGL